MAVSFLKSSRKKEEDDWISISDMMAVLMMIFLFIAIVYMQQVLVKSKIFEIVESRIYDALNQEFKDDFEDWNAVLERKNLTISFQEPDVYFDTGSCVPKQKFISILDSFLPRYLNVLKKFRADIEEIRIEGHTSTRYEAAESIDEAYIKNMDLSQCRTREVLGYLLQHPNIQSNKNWSKDKLTANDLSSSKIVIDPNTGLEDEAKSKRVNFRVKAFNNQFEDWKNFLEEYGLNINENDQVKLNKNELLKEIKIGEICDPYTYSLYGNPYSNKDLQPFFMQIALSQELQCLTNNKEIINNFEKRLNEISTKYLELSMPMDKDKNPRDCLIKYPVNVVGNYEKYEECEVKRLTKLDLQASKEMKEEFYNIFK